MSTEPDARIIIDKLLREADWVMPGEDQPPNVTTEIKNDAGEADYVLLDSDGFPLCAVEAKTINEISIGRQRAGIEGMPNHCDVDLSCFPIVSAITYGILSKAALL